MALRFILSLLLLSAPASADIQFIKECKVYSEPDQKSQPLCLKRPGDIVLTGKPSKAPFVEVVMNDCMGFVSTACISGKGTRKLSSIETRQGFSLALNGFYGGAFGRVSSESTTGNQYGLGLAAGFALNSFRFFLVPEYQYLSLTRVVDGTGSLADTNPVEYTQTLRLVGGRALVGYGLYETTLDGRAGEVGVTGGFELLSPLSATQSTNIGPNQDFQSQDRFVFFLISFYSRFRVTELLYGGLLGEVAYNLTSKGGSSLLTARVGLDIGFDLN